MFVITGGAGFIGSALVQKLNSEGIKDIVIVDELESSEKWKNLRGKSFREYFHKDEFLELVQNQAIQFGVSAVIHMGACSSTTERDVDYLMKNNLRYSQILAEWTREKNIRFIYASSAATYGNGSFGYSDRSELKKLAPLNPYGFSKHLFDLWMEEEKFTAKAVGLKFFNVFGPNEYHKGDMRSMVHKSWGQIKSTGKVKLYKSFTPEFSDGGQKRDFVYVKDCSDVIWWLLNNHKVTGIVNVGSGQARTWNDLMLSVFTALGKEPQIEYIDMPDSLRNQYQNFTEADMKHLRDVGCHVKFHTLEEAVKDYVCNYLEQPDPYL